MSAKPIPEGYRSITPYLIVNDGAKALEFYEKAFGATSIMKMEDPGGKIRHAELQIGDSKVMLADAFPEMEINGPDTYGGSPVGILLYVENVDEVFAEALENGAEEMRPLCDQFYGDRSGTVVDPFGHVWTVATHIEDLSEEELDRRFSEMMGQGDGE